VKAARGKSRVEVVLDVSIKSATNDFPNSMKYKILTSFNLKFCPDPTGFLSRFSACKV